MAHDGLKPADHKLTAAELVALAANTAAHPKALGHELMVTTVEALRELAYGQPHDGIPFALAMAANDELERRALARANLLSAMTS